MGKPVIVSKVGLSPTGELIMIGNDGKPLKHASARVDRSYPREKKGPKILSSIHLPKGSPLLAEPDRALFQFDTIFAIDSNTKTIRDHAVSIAAITLCKWLQKEPAPIAGYATTKAIEFRDIDCHPDLLAWKRFLIEIKEHPNFSEIGKVALIADSHLGDLAKIERREQPILDDFFLPEWVSIVYASDKPKDRLSNILLGEAHRYASNLLNQIENGDWREESQEPFIDHGRYFRIWDFHG
jgi:hypothetical protein